jgi:small subunit ribosomal protein S6
MRDYELAMLVDPGLSEENRQKLLAKIKKIVEDSKGKVGKTEEWGRKKLTYPVKKKDSGYYFLWKLSLPEDIALEADKKIKLEEKILRYLLVRAE